MPEQILDYVTTYATPILFGALILFVGLGMLFGMGRGLKRSFIRLITVVTFIGAAFLLTPAISTLFYNLDINIAGKTPAAWVNSFVDGLGNTDFINSLRMSIPDIDNFLLGVVMAAVNVVLFLGLYFIAKGISWIIYAIVSNYAAPVKNTKTGVSAPKYTFWGMVVGAVQGLVLFFFIMIPVNGLLGVTSQVANYNSLGGIQLDHGTAISSSQTIQATPNNNIPDVYDLCNKLDESMAPYNKFMKYTGIGYLSNKAFDYQMTVKLADSKIILSKDITKTLQLVVDTKEILKTFEKVNQAANLSGNQIVGLAELNHADYEALKYLVNKFFELDLFKLANSVLKDLDKALSAGMSSYSEVLPGTENWSGNKIYEDSIYAYLIKNYASVEEPEKFIIGVRSVVNYVAENGMNVIKNDINNILTFFEDVLTIKIKTPGSPDTARPILVAMNLNKSAPEYIDIITTKIDAESLPTALINKYPSNYTAVDIFFSNLVKFEAFKVAGQTNADYIITYSNILQYSGLNNTIPGLEELIREFTASLLGDKSVGTDQNPGTWIKIKNLLNSSLGISKDYLNIMSDFEDIVTRLVSSSPTPVTPADVMPMAILEYLSSLLGTEEATKYDKINDLATLLHQVTTSFPEVARFASLQVKNFTIPENMQSFGEFKNVLINLLDNASSVEQWKSLFQSIVDVSSMLTSNPVIKDILSVDFAAPDATKQLFDKIVGTEENPGLQPQAVAEIVAKLLDIPNISEVVTEVLVNMDFGYENIKIDINDLKDKTVEELTVVIESLWDEIRAAMQSSSGGII